MNLHVNGFRVYRPARGGRLCVHFGECKTINRIPLPLPFGDCPNPLYKYAMPVGVT